MRYRYSTLDQKNLDWFLNDVTRGTLLCISIMAGQIRGLHDLDIPFQYPITAVAGRNGSGKTTILAIAACACHNRPDGYRLPGRKHPYYTLSDFFIQTADEIPLFGIYIRYQFLHNNWRPTKDKPDGVGLGWQARYKLPGGRWNNYDRRIHRPVVYLGFERVVPHAEKSVSKSYRALFHRVEARGWENDVHTIAGRILGMDYADFEYRQHSKYHLPVVSSRGNKYSGFNMGAGEDALFEIISTIMDSPEGSLFVIDEIELGLHEDAQARLIEELKLLCEKRHIQVICATHSPRILEYLPPEGRIFLDRIGDLTQVIPGISAGYATGKLSGRPNTELDVLVEDEAARLIVEIALPIEVRSRVNVMPIGSSTAVMRHLAARYRENRPSEVCVLLDGDKRQSRETQINQFVSAIEHSDDQEKTRIWVEERLSFLPGEEWPEAWVLSQRSERTCDRLQDELGISRAAVDDILDAARRAGKHNEFFEAATRLCLDEPIMCHHLIRAAFESAPEEAQKIVSFVQSFLDQ